MNDLHRETGSPEERPESETPETAARVRALLEEARSAYDRARQELGEATDRLRGEIKSFDAREASESARQWVRDNPGLSLLIAAGAGVVLGKVLADALRKDPPTLSERLRQRAGRLTGDARRLADLAADRAARQLAESSDYAVTRVRSLGGRVQEQAGERGADGLRRASDWIASLSDTAQQATHALQHAAREASAAVARRVPDRLSLNEGLRKAAQAFVGVVAFKKISDWIKERY